MLKSVFARSLWYQRRSLVWWAAGLLAFATYVVVVYETVFQEQPEIMQVFEQAPDALKVLVGDVSDLLTPAGFLNAELFNLMVPLLLLIFAVGRGSYAVAGEEEQGTLDLLLSYPLPRWRLVLEKFLALVAGLAFLCGALWGGLVTGLQVYDIELAAAHVGAASLSAGLLAAAFGTLALALGCVTGRRGSSSGITAVLAVAAYLLHNYAPLSPRLDGYEVLSPFYYYRAADPLRHGLDPLHASVLAGLTLAFLLLAVLALERRDVRV